MTKPYMLIRKFCNAGDEKSIDQFESDVAMAIAQGGEPLGSTHIQTYTKKIANNEELWVLLAQGIIWNSPTG